MSLRIALSLAILIFFGTLIARLPASALAALLPSGTVCEQPQGTVWHGSCARMQSGALSVNGFGWTVHPSGLVHLQLSADLRSDDPRVVGQAQVQVARNGQIEVHALQAQLPLQGGLSVFPPGVQGTINVDVATLRLQNGALASLVGTLRAQQLRSDSFGELGDFELRFAPRDGGTPADDTSAGTASGTPLSLGGSLAGGSADSTAAVGQLRDLSGPLSLQAQVLLTRQNGYQVSGTLMARASATSELAQAVQLIGPADSEGKRSFSFAGKL